MVLQPNLFSTSFCPQAERIQARIDLLEKPLKEKVGSICCFLFYRSNYFPFSTIKTACLAKGLWTAWRPALLFQGEHSALGEMGLINKSEGEEQLKSSNSHLPSEDQGEEIQQPGEDTEALLRPQKHPVRAACCHQEGWQCPLEESLGTAGSPAGLWKTFCQGHPTESMEAESQKKEKRTKILREKK
ncbi:transmembrane protein 31 [Choloepus didactylus]|uniref:transmembrane protein 31 n=1 Tax=Choloepus didactylus TaxID=27675 RepID=UPI00189F6BCF|nr:transmembrane protein 31 [Choloepus didactylus]